MDVKTVKRYFLCLVVVLIIAAGLHTYAGYTATYGASVADGSHELSNAEIALLSSGSFIARWWVMIVVLLAGTALAVARWAGRRNQSSTA